MEKVSGKLIAGANAANIECGFVPDLVKLIVALAGTILEYKWFKCAADDSGNVGQYGILDSAGTKSAPSTAATGIIAYDTVAPKQMLPSPDGVGLQAAALPSAWTQAIGSAATARSVTALGTIVKPTSGHETGLIYECTTDGTSDATEPTWPTKAGDSVTDGTTVWIARESIIKNVGVKGFTIGATICVDSDIILFEAEKHDRSGYYGDAGIEDPLMMKKTG